MRVQILALVAIGGLLATAGAAAADDTTTTTTTTTTQQPAPGVTVGVPGVVGVTIGGGNAGGCSTHNVTHTDNDTGESVSRTTTDCN